jgi:hypothetical protein
MEVVNKVCHNGADHDSSCDNGRRTPSQAIGTFLLGLKSLHFYTQSRVGNG